MQGRMRYLPALDGIRALAVLAVLFYHDGRTWAIGGFLGVDAFFVLSGFLITGLLLAEWKGNGGIGLSSFWARRGRRLLPALLLVVGAVAIYAALAAGADELRRIRADGLATLGYVANWRFIVSGQSYFEQFNVPSPLHHMWSLAIEEQFYLVWPMVVYAMLRAGKGKILPLAIVASSLGLGSIALMLALYDPSRDPSRVYFGTDTRASSLIIGALLAMLIHVHPIPTKKLVRYSLHIAGAVAFVVLVWFWATTPDKATWLYGGGFVLCAILVATIIADVSQASPGPLGTALSWPPLRWIGAISYGLYLWHWPIYVYLSGDRTGLSPNRLFAVRILITFAVATISYYLIEQPIRHGAWRGWPIRLATPLAVFVVAGGLLWSTAGAPAPPVEISARDIAPPPTTAAEETSDQEPMRVMLVGDSLANSLAPGLEKDALDQGFLLWNASVPGCGFGTETGERKMGDQWVPADAKCTPLSLRRWKAQVDQWNPDTVILFGAQQAYDRRIDGVEVPYDSAAGKTRSYADLKKAVNIFSSRGAQVVLLTSLYSRLGWPISIDLNRSGFNDRWIDQWTKTELAVAATNPDQVRVIDINAFLNPDGTYTETIDGVASRTDGIHLTTQAADIASRWLTPQILAIPRQSITQSK